MDNDTALTGMYTALVDAETAADTIPWWRCPYWQRARVECLVSDQATIRIGRTVWHAARQRPDGTHAFTLTQVREIRTRLDEVITARQRVLERHLRNLI